ncbi:ribonuclease H family protein [Sporosarcina sp. YIM B06819]|uniref:ribonuclease H family protein n=1 Tax=Sporosarcina sp. YIM B06819 TaxID=3081769 RepID=UPI00298BEBCA|nr:ribonuclease H family protein [Sporosarcina sp. YIM B06819]
MGREKFYVVWRGKNTGIYLSWDECKEQVLGYKGAKYKSYNTKIEAEEAFKADGNIAIVSTSTQLRGRDGNQLTLFSDIAPTTYYKESICVDAACSGNPGDMEYQGVCTKTGKVIFRYGPVPNGTNNIGEFLAIVHALALLQQSNNSIPIYSDSLTAMAWVRKKQVNTNIPRNKSTEQLWKIIERAQKWLLNNTYSNEIIKWETKIWGEIKADFGRK